MRKAIAGAAIAMATLASTGHASAWQPTHRLDESGKVWVVHDTDQATFDARPGDRVDVVLTGPDQTWDRCQDYGGDDLIGYPTSGQMVCEGVDF